MLKMYSVFSSRPFMVKVVTLSGRTSRYLKPSAAAPERVHPVTSGDPRVGDGSRLLLLTGIVRLIFDAVGRSDAAVEAGHP